MLLSLPRVAPFLRDPLRERSCRRPGARMSPPPTARTSPATTVGGAIAEINGLSRVEPRTAQSPPVARALAACSQRNEAKKENRRSRRVPHGLLLRGDTLILAPSRARFKARRETHSNEGSSGSSDPFSYRIEASPPLGRTIPSTRNRAPCRRSRTETYGELSGTAARSALGGSRGAGPFFGAHPRCAWRRSRLRRRDFSSRTSCCSAAGRAEGPPSFLSKSPRRLADSDAPLVRHPDARRRARHSGLELPDPQPQATVTLATQGAEAGDWHRFAHGVSRPTAESAPRASWSNGPSTSSSFSRPRATGAADLALAHRHR